MITETKYLKSINGNENEFSRNYLRGPDAIFENWENRELYIKFSYKNGSNWKIYLLIFTMGLINGIILINFTIGLINSQSKSNLLAFFYLFEYFGIVAIDVSIFFLIMLIGIFYWIYRNHLKTEFLFDKDSDKVIIRKSIFSKKKNIKHKNSSKKISDISIIKIVRKIDVRNYEDISFKIFLKYKKLGRIWFFYGKDHSQTMDYVVYLKQFLGLNHTIKIKETHDYDNLDLFITPFG